MTGSQNNAVRDWTPQQVYDAICHDFETAWNGVAATPDAPGQGRGNFLFANQAMILLEWACRLCAGDSSGTALDEFSRCLANVQPRYFTAVRVNLTGKQRDFLLPASTNPLPANAAPLLWMLFDLIRNGLAHQYQQIILRLSDGKVYVSLGGPSYEQSITQMRQNGAGRHLAMEHRGEHLGLIVRPDWLYFDFKTAIDQSNILAKGLQPVGLTRSDQLAPYAGLTVTDLEHGLSTAGHGLVVQTVGTWTNASPSSTTSCPPTWLVPPTSAH